MEITTNASPKVPAILQDETMKSPSILSNDDAPMQSPPAAFDMSDKMEESATASPHAPSPRSPQPEEGPSIMVRPFQGPHLALN
ncbi:hypothetical protein PISMIDRAFT_20291 [Pisolithus microcarpus 441]|uniref:Uncharacterized protein n=1 Tax=Pisolithus microcarpus 441 TaxID=765257 RepID=A0A0C9YJM1_9AGAM|nr:hypothetical protein PISMIDRAFT_20291 [Pisolithus microcarpus 441]